MNLSQLDLNLLIALDALLREQNVTRAGQRIGLSQPAMSSSLGRLRNLFGDDLLVRVGRRYYPTPLALELTSPVQEILRLIEETVERRPGFNPATDERLFRIATSDYAALMVLERLVPVLALEAPNLKLRTIPTGFGIREQLATGEVDLAFLPQLVGTALPSHEVLFEDRWVCAVAANHPEVGETLSMEQFLELPHVTFRPGEGETSMADRALDNLGITRHVQVVVNNQILLPMLLKDTPYVCLIYEHLARRLLSAADVRLLEPPLDIPKMTLAMFWPAQSTSDPANCWLRQKIVEVCAELAAG